MRRYMVVNAKGGCGKSTLATNIAAYFASQWENVNVSLADFDPQQSSMDWLAVRPEDRPPIAGIDAHSEGLKKLNPHTDFLVMDAPASTHGPELTAILKHAETVIIPVLPSTVDMRAASRFIEEIRNVGKVSRREVKIGVVANRVREHYSIYRELEEFLKTLKVPVIGHLRDAQNYVRAYGNGLGVWELAPYMAWQEWQQWEPIAQWLESKRSQP
ncbi:MAG TPA: ParA family protein [Candidatus Krumholzibacteria bacterium]|nr:ParA family protein [Candidatus Krumholzibacteria bacterium]